MTVLVPEGVTSLERGYLGRNQAFNSVTHSFFRLLPLNLYEGLIRAMAAVLIFKRFSFHDIYLVLQKPS